MEVEVENNLRWAGTMVMRRDQCSKVRQKAQDALKNLLKLNGDMYLTNRDYSSLALYSCKS